MAVAHQSLDLVGLGVSRPTVDPARLAVSPPRTTYPGSYLRSRRDDIAALRVVGAGRRALRRSAVVEQLAVVLSGVVVGAAAGVLGAHLAMPSIPIFVDKQAVPDVRLPIAWPSMLVAAGLVAALLVTTAVVAALRLTRSAGRQSTREDQR